MEVLRELQRRGVLEEGRSRELLASCSLQLRVEALDDDCCIVRVQTKVHKANGKGMRTLGWSLDRERPQTGRGQRAVHRGENKALQLVQASAAGDHGGAVNRLGGRRWLEERCELRKLGLPEARRLVAAHRDRAVHDGHAVGGEKVGGEGCEGRVRAHFDGKYGWRGRVDLE